MNDSDTAPAKPALNPPADNRQTARLDKARLFRLLTLLGYFGLLILLMLWFTWLAPPRTAPISMVLLGLVVPLLLPLRGLLHGRIYTHRWAAFLALLYFMLGIDVAYTNPAEAWLGILEVIFSVIFFSGAVGYARYGREAA